MLGRCAAVLSGYLGDPGMADVVARAVAAVRRARPDALYLCDPVIGDDGPGVFVSAGVPEAIRERLAPLADIVVPNRFELAHLTARPVESLEEVRAAAAELRARGPRLVVVTGLSLRDRPGELAVLADTAGEAWLVVDATAAARDRRRHWRCIFGTLSRALPFGGRLAHRPRAGSRRHVRPGRADVRRRRRGA